MNRRIVVLVLIAALFLGALPFTWAQDNSATITTSALRVRQEPNTTAPVVATLGLNEVVTMTGRTEDTAWIFITKGEVSGWVSSTFLRYSIALGTLPVVATSGTSGAAPAEAAANAAPVEGGIAATVNADANIRQTPNGTRIGGAVTGTTATLIGRTADNQWVLAVFPSLRGWVAASLVNATGAITSLPVTDAGGQAQTTTTTTNSAPASVALPLPSGGISGFAYGAHVNGFGGTEIMPSLGMTWVKKQVRYNRGDDPSSAAWIINEGRGRGFRVLLGVVGSTSDVASGGDAYFADYANFVAGLAALGADAIEVWNEPNLDREWPNGMVDPAMYTRLLAVSYNAIKGANPNTIVISGAPAPTGFFGGCSPSGCDDAVFLQGMRAAGAAAYMDCTGAHYNEGVVAPTASSGDPRSEFYTRYLPSMISTYAVLGKPICFTELGYLTGDGYGGMPPGFEWGAENTIQEQAAWIRDAINVASNSGRVRMVIIWNFNFVTAPGTPDPAGGYAMLRPDGSCPACDALRH
jgi:uncharacterized protein YraI